MQLPATVRRVLEVCSKMSNQKPLNVDIQKDVKLYVLFIWIAWYVISRIHFVVIFPVIAKLGLIAEKCNIISGIISNKWLDYLPKVKEINQYK